MRISAVQLCLTAAMLPCIMPGSALADEWNKHWNTGSKPELRIHAGDAAVVIQASDNSGIDAYVTTRGWSIGRGGIQITEHQTGDTVDLDIRVPSSMFNLGEKSIRLELRVPRTLTGDVHTGDGSIKVLGTHGTLRLDTGDGSITGEDLDGTLEARSGDGSVHIVGRFDSLQLHTQDGSVELDAKPGSTLQSSWRLETGDGSMRVGVPNGLKADLEVRTGDGHIQVDLPGLSSQNKGEHEVRGQLNGGGPTLLVKTGDGSIRVLGR